MSHLFQPKGAFCDRRDFLQTMASAYRRRHNTGFAAGCGAQQAGVVTPAPEAIAQDSSFTRSFWQMATSWPVAAIPSLAGKRFLPIGFWR
ncbi:MAG: hypothetical protein R2867_43585 [Caldilineaceae bacterium]